MSKKKLIELDENNRVFADQLPNEISEKEYNDLIKDNHVGEEKYRERLKESSPFKNLSRNTK